VELVRDKVTKEPLSRKVTRAIFDEAVRRGLLTMAYAPSFRIQPALTIDVATARNGVAILREVFDHVKRTGIWEQT
jgi:4-aminobutyrate aminotransferase-like enzyme